MGSFSFVKVMMVLFNLVILVAGLSLAAVGVWVSVDGGPFLQVLAIFSLSAQRSFNVGFYFIAIGSVLVLLSLLGCCAARKESKCLLIMFFSIVLVVFLSELSSAVILLTWPPLVDTVLKAWAVSVLQQYGRDSTITDIWNTTMMELQCCGFTNYTDFSDSYYYKKHGGAFPPSCCNHPERACYMANALNSVVKGCYKWLVPTVEKKVFIIGGIAAGVSGVKLAAMAVSMYLYCYLDTESS